MNKYYKYGIVAILLLVAYVIGILLPINALIPEFTDEPFSKSEYYRLMISIIGAIITFMAVMVALFKDDIRERWKRPKIKFCATDNMTFEDTTTNNDSESGADNVRAKRYVSRVEVTNNGNLPALNAEVYLDKLEYTPKDSEIAQHIDSSGAPLDWNGTDSQTIIIPPGGKKLLNIVEMTPPEKTSTPDSEKTNKPAKLVIGNISSTKDKMKGKWKATYTLYAQNHKPTSFTVEINWSGIWKNRLTELNNQYQIKKEE